ncbi:hypothetical protein A2U01_0080337, partial [Trifolium medium]|nr:hypothetical protein [Trifolium medium]
YEVELMPCELVEHQLSNIDTVLSNIDTVESMDMPTAAVWDKREWSTEAADKEIEAMLTGD